MGQWDRQCELITPHIACTRTSSERSFPEKSGSIFSSGSHFRLYWQCQSSSCYASRSAAAAARKSSRRLKSPMVIRQKKRMNQRLPKTNRVDPSLLAQAQAERRRPKRKSCREETVYLHDHG